MKKALGIVIALLIIGSAGATAAYFVYQNFFNPQVEIQRMVAAMKALETVHFEVEAVVSNFDSSAENSLGAGMEDFNASLSGDLVQKKGQEQIDYAINFQIAGADEGSEDFTGQIRGINDLIYVKISRNSVLEDIFGYLGETWVQFDKGEFKNLAAPDSSMINQTDGLSVHQQEQIEKLFRSVDLVIVTSVSKVIEMIDGHVSRMYEVQPNPDGIRTFAIGLIRIIEEREPTTEELEGIEEFIDAISELDGKLWIEPNTHLLYKMTVGGSIKEIERGFDLELTAVFSKHNETMVIEEPKDAKTFLEILGDSFGGIFGGLPTAEEGGSANIFEMEDFDFEGLPEGGTIIGVDSDGDGISDADEGFYGTDPNNPDSDGDGYTDGEEIESGNNPLGTGHLFQFGLPEM